MCGELVAILVEPLLVRLLRREARLDLAIVLHLAGGRVEADHLARGEAPLALDLRIVEVDDADLRADGQDTVSGQLEAGRAQAVAVEAGGDLLSVGEHQRGRAIPRFGETAVELVEGALLLRRGRVDAPRGRHEHRHRMGDVAPGKHQRLERPVEARGIRLLVVEQIVERLDVVAPDLVGKIGLAGGEPVAVPPQGVDLAVVGEHPERLTQPPGREGIGREALVVEADRCLVVRVLQVEVELVDPAGDHHHLVADHAARERRAVEIGDRFVR